MYSELAGRVSGKRGKGNITFYGRFDADGK